MTTFTVHRNKLRADALEHTKGESFQFTTTLLPYPLLCLTHLVCVAGIHSNAFKVGHQTVNDLIHRPEFGPKANYIPLDWRKDLLDQPIFNMSYATFTRKLHTVLLVAGFRKAPRTYAFRIGALIEYDKALTQATRNFVASHSTKIFESNYQTRNVRVNLAGVRFGACAGGASDESLFQVLRDLSKQNDSGAPIAITAEQRRSIELRRDVTERREAVEQAKIDGDDASVKEKRSALSQRRRVVTELVLEKSREKYFVDADECRAAGLPTDHLIDSSRSSRSQSEHASFDIGGVMKLWTGEAGFGDRAGTSEDLSFDAEAEVRSEKAMEWLVGYAAMDRDSKAKSKASKACYKAKAPNVAKISEWTCLLCVGTKWKSSFTERGSLTRHNTSRHIKNHAFDISFPCPRCVSDGVSPPPMISSAIGWADHMTVHGLEYTPVVTEKHLSIAAADEEEKKSTKRKRGQAKAVDSLCTGETLLLDLSDETMAPSKRQRNNDGSSSGSTTDCDGESFQLFLFARLLKDVCYFFRFATVLGLCLGRFYAPQLSCLV